MLTFSLRPIRQRLAIAASAAGVLLATALPAAASAAGLASVSGGVLSYTDGSTAANRLTISPLGSGAFRVVDAVGVFGGAGCSQVSTIEVTCGAVTSINVGVGAGDDDVSVNVGAAASPNVTLTGGSGTNRLDTGPGADTISGGTGVDTINPGAGADKVNAYGGADVISGRDGVADTLKCGPDSDSGVADPTDSIDKDCEAVDNSVLGSATGEVVGTPPAAGTTTDPAATDSSSSPGPSATSTPIAKIDPLANPLPVVIPAQAMKLDSKGNAPVRVACPAGVGRCKGTVTLEVAARDLGKARAAAAAAKLVKVGQARFTAKAGAKPVVTVHLSRRGRRRVIRGRKRQHCRITVSTTSPTGKTLVTRRTITLVAERRTVKRGTKRGPKR